MQKQQRRRRTNKKSDVKLIQTTVLVGSEAKHETSAAFEKIFGVEVPKFDANSDKQSDMPIDQLQCSQNQVMNVPQNLPDAKNTTQSNSDVVTTEYEPNNASMLSDSDSGFENDDTVESPNNYKKNQLTKNAEMDNELTSDEKNDSKHKLPVTDEINGEENTDSKNEHDANTKRKLHEVQDIYVVTGAIKRKKQQIDFDEVFEKVDKVLSLPDEALLLNSKTMMQTLCDNFTQEFPNVLNNVQIQSIVDMVPDNHCSLI